MYNCHVTAAATNPLQGAADGPHGLNVSRIGRIMDSYCALYYRLRLVQQLYIVTSHRP